MSDANPTHSVSQRGPTKTVTFFFEEESAPNSDGYPIKKAAVVDGAWRNGEQFEAPIPSLRSFYRRKAIAKLENLT